MNKKTESKISKSEIAILVKDLQMTKEDLIESLKEEGYSDKEIKEFIKSGNYEEYLEENKPEPVPAMILNKANITSEEEAQKKDFKFAEILSFKFGKINSNFGFKKDNKDNIAYAEIDFNKINKVSIGGSITTNLDDEPSSFIMNIDKYNIKVENCFRGVFYNNLTRNQFILLKQQYRVFLVLQELENIYDERLNDKGFWFYDFIMGIFIYPFEQEFNLESYFEDAEFKFIFNPKFSEVLRSQESKYTKLTITLDNEKFSSGLLYKWFKKIYPNAPQGKNAQCILKNKEKSAGKNVETQTQTEKEKFKALEKTFKYCLDTYQDDFEGMMNIESDLEQKKEYKQKLQLLKEINDLETIGLKTKEVIAQAIDMMEYMIPVIKESLESADIEENVKWESELKNAKIIKDLLEKKYDAKIEVKSSKKKSTKKSTKKTTKKSTKK